MIFYSLLTLVLTSLPTVHTLASPSALVTVGILSQPASEPMKLQYYHPSDNWTFVAGSYVDWVGSAGAMPVLIPFDIDWEEMVVLLDGIDAVLLPGGGANLMKRSDVTVPSYYQVVTNRIIQWVKERNDKGKFYPLFATCLGFENLIIEETNSTATLECDLDDEVAAHSVEIVPAFDSSPFWQRVGIDLAKKVFATDSIYYTHSCGIRDTSFLKSKRLTDAYTLLGTSVSRNNIKFVACVEHKKYPIIGNQWHPEKTLFERGKLYEFLDRSDDATELMQRIISRFVHMVREKGSPKNSKDIGQNIKKLFSSNRVSETLPLSFYERVYTFQRYHYYE